MESRDGLLAVSGVFWLIGVCLGFLTESPGRVFSLSLSGESVGEGSGVETSWYPHSRAWLVKGHRLKRGSLVTRGELTPGEEDGEERSGSLEKSRTE